METTLDSALAENKSQASPHPVKKIGQVVDKYLNEIKEFENDRVALAKESATKAWKVATAFGALAFLAVGAVVVMMPLKHIEPYLLKVDSATGHTEVVRPLRDAKGISYGEVLDKYWLNQFVIARNGYEWETIQNNFNTVKLMSGRQVFGAYSYYIKGDNSPTKMFEDKKVIVATVQGVTFLPTKPNEEALAQVRFTRTIETNEGAPALGYAPTQWTATVTFDYRASINTEDERLLNPLGFQVTSYREDRILN